MTETIQPAQANWSLLQKICFRFFFIYFMLTITPWEWLDNTIVPFSYTHYINGFYDTAVDWIVNLFNKYWFHFPKTQIVNNGSGDTSANWEMTFTNLTLALAGCVIWSVADRKRNNYITANYWLRTFLRYFIISMCFIYGIGKLYALQMPFPTQSQLATPLGDFLPMRFSWMFIGYATPYQMFSGAMEVLAGLLLLNRRTITLGLFVGAVVFMNVMVLNLCYDIPVKLFSTHLTIYCFYLLTNDIKRLYSFFVLNHPTPPHTLDQIRFPKKWMRITRLMFKIIFIGLFVVLPFYTTRDRYRAFNKEADTRPFRQGLYDVTVLAVNKDTVPALISDTLRWKDMVFDKNGAGSVGSTDTTFRQRYRRGYFNFVTDTISKTIRFKKFVSDTIFTHSFRYELSDSTGMRLWGKHKSDSFYVVLKKSNLHFQLAEKQFHWISEANR